MKHLRPPSGVQRGWFHVVSERNERENTKVAQQFVDMEVRQSLVEQFLQFVMVACVYVRNSGGDDYVGTDA